MHCIISGLSKCKYVRLNQKDKTPINPDPNREYIKIEREYLDVFLEVPEVVEVSNMSRDGLKLRITCKDDNDVLIYNPWDESGRLVPEDSLHNKNEYLHCLGVGNGFLRSEITLQPKETWQSSQTIEIIDEKEEARIQQLQTLLSNPWDMLMGPCSNVDTDLY
ncbi:hypothetical protein GWI33_009758 [Rhynchophorus ferrugineus]|uniref:Uncharacterized protein n=1 Tax=Rhynchophorus ferrugineus TaxID=354439 RepID=A0A834MCP4_RHYFE|nr:hypothetical protein GWI33_009758 [Rhynchophorus ferrugineus]